MERYEQKVSGLAYPQAPDGPRAAYDWFDVAGDLDDFIFYDGWQWSPDEDPGPVSRR